MKQLLILAGLLFLSGCGMWKVHKDDVQQGNILESKDFSALHVGMTRAQVMEKIGSPVLENQFERGKDAYVYSLKPGYGTYQSKQVTLIFQSDRLVKIQK